MTKTAQSDFTVAENRVAALREAQPAYARSRRRPCRPPSVRPSRPTTATRSSRPVSAAARSWTNWASRSVELARARVDLAEARIAAEQAEVATLEQLRGGRGKEWQAARDALDEATARFEAADAATYDAANAHSSARERLAQAEAECRAERAALAQQVQTTAGALVPAA